MTEQEQIVKELDIVLAESNLLGKVSKTTSPEALAKLIDSEMERISKKIIELKKKARL